jgi:hypothetical protein
MGFLAGKPKMRERLVPQGFSSLRLLIVPWLNGISNLVPSTTRPPLRSANFASDSADLRPINMPALKGLNPALSGIFGGTSPAAAPGSYLKRTQSLQKKQCGITMPALVGAPPPESREPKRVKSRATMTTPRSKLMTAGRTVTPCDGIRAILCA